VLIRSSIEKGKIFFRYVPFPQHLAWEYRYILNCFMKYLIPKRCLYILLSTALFLSCKKNSSSPPVDTPSQYFIKATIDGVDYEFKDLTSAITTEPSNLFAYATNTDSVGSADEMRITFEANQRSVISGVYTDTSDVYGCYLTLLQSGIFYQSTSAFDAANRLICTIDSIDSASVSGTFSGIVYYFPTSAIYKTITNGSFTVPF
jgi:hypothetical protein